MRRLLTLGVLAAVAAPGHVQAQAVGRIEGTVVSEEGQPIPSATVSVAGTEIGTLTNAAGAYVLTNVPIGPQTVIARAIGYEQHAERVTVTSGETGQASFQLGSQAVLIEGIVAVGYGTQARELVTGAVASVSGETLEAIPTTNLSNTMAGKLSGVLAVNPSGEPGANGSTIRIRGNHTLNDNSPLIVIDGVPDREGGLERLSPEDIENVSVLKDASAAIYGSRAANGVILVTTKRGTLSSPQVSVNVSSGMTQPTRLPKMTDAATYMTMLNESDVYRGLTPRYDDAYIANFADPDADRWLYPNTNWYSEVLRTWAPQQKANISLRGGTEAVRYFLSLGGLMEDGIYRNSATRYNQYNFRSNLDGQVGRDVSVRFDLTGRMEDRNYPVRPASTIFGSTVNGKPNQPARWPNGLPGPDIENGNNPVVIATDETGYTKNQGYFLQSNLGLDVDVAGVPGLTVRGNVAYDQRFDWNKSWRTPWTLYSWDGTTRDANGDPVVVGNQRGFAAPELSESTNRNRGLLLNAVAEYRRTLGDHSFSALVGTERQLEDYNGLSAFRKDFVSDQIDEIFAGSTNDLQNGSSAGLARRQNYFSRLNYDFAGRYLAELIARYDGSYIFAEDRRFGFFPAFSLGWRISDEAFFRGAAPFIDDLKLRGSWGQTGNDRVDQWQYLATYGYGAGYVFGTDEVTSVRQTRTPNPEVTWEVANQLDLGLDGAMLGNRLQFSLDWFSNRRSDILTRRNASVPQTAGITLPLENIGEVKSWGYDGSISYLHPFSHDLSVDVTLNGSYAQNRIVYWDETGGAPAYQRSTGYRMGSPLYYKAIGIFRDQAHVDSYPHLDGARPGDIIYEDHNGDGIIDGDDRVRINKTPDPTFVAGLTLGVERGPFRVSTFFQGATGGAQWVLTNSNVSGNFYDEYAKNRWTESNPNASEPRTFLGGEYWLGGNTHWYRDNDYLRLKSMEVSYDVPEALSSRVGIDRMRLYATGYNLLTWDKLKYMDPETRTSGGGYYPQSRVITAGTSFSF